MTPTLFADRFLAWPGGRGLDLASGQHVWLRPGPGDQGATAGWAQRCAGLSGLSHPHLVDMVDFGPAGHDGTFEVLGTAPPPHARWNGRDAATARALLSVVGFLHARGCRAGALAWSQVVPGPEGPALLPDAETGRPLDGEEVSDAPDAQPTRVLVMAEEAARLDRLLAACEATPRSTARPRGTRGRHGTHQEPAAVRDATARLAEVLDSGAPARPRALQLVLPPEPQQRLLVRALVRTARLRGYVPVSTAIFDGRPGFPSREELFALIADRHVLLLHRPGASGRETDLALGLLRLGLSNNRPHVVLLLLDAATPGAWARGWPRAAVLQARETRPSYLVKPEFREHRAHNRILDAAASVRRGRHAAAQRLLKETSSMASRRGDQAAAGEAAVALGRLLLLRGRVEAAGDQFEAARAHFDAAREVTWALRAAIFAALARTDAGRFEESEAAARAARIAASETGDTDTGLLASLALSRCLYWQGRYDEGQAALREEAPAAGRADAWVARVAESATPFLPGPRGDAWRTFPGWVDPQVARRCLLARHALARGDLAAAGRNAVEARELARAASEAAANAAACLAAAEVYAAIGDADMLRREVAAGLAAARDARAPLRAIRLRASLVRGLVTCGRASEAKPLAARLARLDPARLPVVVRLALRAALDAALGRREPAPRARGVVVPIAQAAPAAAGVPGRDVVGDVVDILNLCQESEDDDRAVRSIVSRIRRRCGTAVTACFGKDGDALWALAFEGYDPTPEGVARRAVDCGQAVAPSSSLSRQEAAVPIRFAGRIVGALGCRWTADVEPDWPLAGALLAAAAAAIAPCVRAAVDRRVAEAQAAAAAGEEILGVSEAVRLLRQEIARAAAAPFSMIVEGESGSGKELVARAVHRLGPRAHRRLCALNCAALSDELFEAELFGHARGAFTGAVADRKGLFEEADGGTLVLDEVGELTARAQAKLLRAIQEGEIRRIGENFSRPVDVRLVSATNRPLRAAAQSGLFRRDLLYRLEVIRILVPPLRDRVEDIPALAMHFWRASAGRLGSRATLAPETVAALARYDWPGNVRELQNVMAALAVQAPRRGSIGPALLPGIIAGTAVRRAATLEDARAVFESRYVRAALARAGGHRGQAARDLGLSRQGLAKLLARLHIEPHAGSADLSCQVPVDAAG